VSEVTVIDFALNATTAQTLSGNSSNNTLIGGSGGDTITTGSGTDSVYGHAGNDTITVDGVGVKTIDGSTGTDSLTVSYSGISGLSDFTISQDGDYIVLTDSNGNSVSYKSIESLTVGSYAYTVDDGDAGANGTGTYYNAIEKALYFYNGGTAHIGHRAFAAMHGNTNNLTMTGSSGNDYINMNLDRTPGVVTQDIGGLFTINLGDGNDTLMGARLANGDSVDMGAGDDSVSVMAPGAPQTLSNINLAKLDGGAGTDTLKFEESLGEDPNNPDHPGTLTLTTGGATNFENLRGTSDGETLTGDANANVLEGLNGADTINGLGGDDMLWAGGGTFNDQLYGGAGDDTLDGSDGDNTLDGGTGKDTINSGGGSDTIVIRSGDGSTNIANADVLTDFTDGSDGFGIDGLNYGDLTVQQGTGDYANHVLVKYGAEYLIVIQNASVSNVTSPDFTPL
jgi:Ca2+-binding RTX toxin-like protein